MIPKTYSQAVEEMGERKERKDKRKAKWVHLDEISVQIGSKSLQDRARRVKKVPKAKRHKRLVKALDVEFSLAVRERGSKSRDGLCEFDWCPNLLEQCFHFVTRAKFSTRWDFSNAAASCRSCNMEMEYNPHKFIQWYIKRYGLTGYEDLVRRSNIIPKFSDDHLEEKLLTLKASRAQQAEDDRMGR